MSGIQIGPWCIFYRPRHVIHKWWFAWGRFKGEAELQQVLLSESEATEWYKEATPPAEPFRAAGADGVYRC